MSIGPRISLLRFSSRHAPALEPWQEHCRRVIGGPAPTYGLPTDVAVPSIVVWQLLSLNNRILARSALLYPGVDNAEERVERLVAASARIETHLVSNETRNLFGWFASISGVPVMTASRWFVTERDRRNSLELAVASLAVATVQPGTRSVRPERGRR
ncbi:hypothetical protein [Lacisediminihabitans changchengi]|uniref:Uncharacterized protein n=1 Tax=Lacisediminihabitans changchengi TaxID=2787634 RepID=A0A934W461_9MICO|nr:hypothetical protein [Lacisediminihabitans changchengi]MBK4348616.1 hypothetical protein [Lacisediminihabitans changchengi]